MTKSSLHERPVGNKAFVTPNTSFDAVTVLKPAQIINQAQHCVICALNTLNVYLNHAIPLAAVFFANKSDDGEFPLKWQDKEQTHPWQDAV